MCVPSGSLVRLLDIVEMNTPTFRAAAARMLVGVEGRDCVFALGG